jgi:hypothetical protein
VSEKNVIMVSDEDILLMEELLSEEYLRSIRLLAENNSPRAKERCEMVQSLHIRLVKIKQNIAIKRFLDD